MPQRDGCAIVIVSDFHLAAGYDSRRTSVDPNEQFVHDDAFARFLDALRSRAQNDHRRWRLLLLGDMFDFPRARMAVLRDQPGHASPAIDINVAGLDRIAAGHPRVFEALGTVLSAGVEIDIVPGNHDVELMRPAVYEHLTHLLARGGQADVVDRIRFHPWIYYVPGVLYAEHGNQYHDINSFAALLALARGATDAESMPVGAALDELVLDLRERYLRIRQKANGDAPVAPTVRQAIREQPSIALTTLPLQAHFLRSLGRQLTYSAGRRSTRRAAYHDAAVRPYAAELGLSYETVVAIDNLAASAAMDLRKRLASTVVVDPIRRRLRPVHRDVLRPEARRAAYLHQAALAVHHILRADGMDVPHYVFGHSHLAERRQLANPDDVPVYLNPGSWTVTTPVSPSRPGGTPALTFVEVDVAAETNVATARVMRWDDTRGTIEPWDVAATSIGTG